MRLKQERSDDLGLFSSQPLFRLEQQQRSSEDRGAVTSLRGMSWNIALRLLGSTDLQPHRHFDVHDMDGQDVMLHQNVGLQVIGRLRW